MKSAREVAHAKGNCLAGQAAFVPGGRMPHSKSCDDRTAAIEARDAEVRAETIEAADPGCDCVPGYGQHPECKGARDAAKRIRSLTEKSKPGKPNTNERTEP